MPPAPPPRHARELEQLTPREREVLALLADGRSDQEIADALFISAKTASVHVTNIKAKLGVDTRLEAGTLALRLRLAPNGPEARSRLASARPR